MANINHNNIHSHNMGVYMMMMMMILIACGILVTIQVPCMRPMINILYADAQDVNLLARDDIAAATGRMSRAAATERQESSSAASRESFASASRDEIISARQASSSTTIIFKVMCPRLDTSRLELSSLDIFIHVYL